MPTTLSDLESALSRLPSFEGMFREPNGITPGEDGKPTHRFARRSFNMRFIGYDGETSSFLAFGEDPHGTSLIMGAVDDRGEVRFQKTYINLRRVESREKVWPHERSFADDGGPCRTFDYVGRVFMPDKKITIGGRWKRRTAKYVPGQDWKLDSVSFQL